MTPIENYERSYRSMWQEIERLRAARDSAHHPGDAARDLIIALEYQLGLGMKLPEDVFVAYHRLRDLLHMKKHDKAELILGRARNHGADETR